jgi:hypothetical protein
VRLLTITTSIGRHGGPASPEFVPQRSLSFAMALDDGHNLPGPSHIVYWVGRDGTVRGVSEGEASEAALRGAFEALLADR